MRRMYAVSLAIALALTARPDAQDKPKVALPEPGVSQIMTLEGLFVRAAYNNEGYVILGYRTANMSLGDEWMMLEIGTTMREGTPAYKMTRDAISLTAPDHPKIPLATVAEYRDVDLRALEQRSKVTRDSINYFPPMASQACRIGFFSDVDNRAMSWEEVEVSYNRACLGRLYFRVPGGIKYGQHWLNVQFPKSLVRVPFRIFTKEEEKFASKNYSDIRKQVKEAFKPAKKDKKN